MPVEIITTYHAFTDERDDWFNTKEEAIAQCDRWYAEGFSNLRVYEERSERDGDMVDEDCVYAVGDFPW